MSRRFVAIGDSFTEGVGDENPAYPNGVRGWADRVAEQLAAKDPGFRYANLAIRGRLLLDVIAEQLDPAIAMKPDLVSFYAGGNDLMRPSVDIDTLAEHYEAAVAQLTAAGATVLMFTGVDGVGDALFRKMRGRTAIYNELLRGIAVRHGCLVVDMWSMRQLRDRRLWSPDRLHLNAAGHQRVAGLVLAALGHTTAAHVVDPGPAESRRVLEEARYYRRHVLPWLHRRLRGRSSGDGRSGKYVDWVPIRAA